MKISKLIELLQEELKEHGDTTVVCDSEASHVSLYPCDYIETSSVKNWVPETHYERFGFKKDDLVTFIGVDL